MEPVSVVIPTYNRAGWIPYTVASVLEATADCDEIIVVDDGSTDDTAAVIEANRARWHGRVRYVSMKHGGAGRAQNFGVACAKHDLIAFADSDDLWLPYRLELQRPVMECERSLGFCFSNFGHLEKDGRVTPHWLVKWSGDPRDWEHIMGPGREYSERWPPPQSLLHIDPPIRIHRGSMYVRELHRNYINVNTLLVRRSVVGAALHFGEDIARYNDWECFVRISRVSECAYLAVDTALQRDHAGPRRTDSGPLIAAQSRITLIERTWARDPVFMAAHGTEVRSILAAQSRIVVRNLIRLNRRKEARRLLGDLDGAWRERLALMVPHTVLKHLGFGA